MRIFNNSIYSIIWFCIQWFRIIYHVNAVIIEFVPDYNIESLLLLDKKEEEDYHYSEALNCQFESEKLEVYCGLVSNRKEGIVGEKYNGFAKLELSDLELQTELDLRKYVSEVYVLRAYVYYSNTRFDRIIDPFETEKGLLHFVFTNGTYADFIIGNISIKRLEEIAFPPWFNSPSNGIFIEDGYTINNNGEQEPNLIPADQCIINVDYIRMMHCDVESNNPNGIILNKYNGKAQFTLFVRSLENPNNCILENELYSEVYLYDDNGERFEYGIIDTESRTTEYRFAIKSIDDCEIYVTLFHPGFRDFYKKV